MEKFATALLRQEMIPDSFSRKEKNPNSEKNGPFSTCVSGDGRGSNPRPSNSGEPGMPETTVEEMQEARAEELADFGITAKPWDYLGNMMLSAKATAKVLQLLRKLRSLEKGGKEGGRKSVGMLTPSE